MTGKGDCCGLSLFFLHFVLVMISGVLGKIRSAHYASIFDQSKQIVTNKKYKIFSEQCGFAAKQHTCTVCQKILVAENAGKIKPQN